MRYLALAIFASVSLAHAGQVGRSPPAPAEESTNSLAPLTLGDLTVTRERPLFSPTRRPPPPPAPAEAPAPPAVERRAEALAPPPFEIVGAVLGEGVGFVLLRDRETHEVKRLGVNGVAGGWKVGALGPRSVQLERDGRIVTLTLGGPVAAAAPPAPLLAGAAPAAGPVGETVPSDSDSRPQAEYDRLMRKLHIQ